MVDDGVVGAWAVALAVQPLECWRELWVLRKTEGDRFVPRLPRGRCGGRLEMVR